MEFEIVNPGLLVDEIIETDPKDSKKIVKRTLVIKKNNKNSYLGITRLGDVINCLPAGIVHKEETGMGGTTLELATDRNSIIVEPIKVTASSKAAKHTKESGELVLYVGSETAEHPKQATHAEIKSYVNDASIKNKKIIVVADSLYKVINAIGDDAFQDYFLLIDEADTFQMDSSYRRSMEVCMDYYKKFNNEQRCLLSATIIGYSDPDLQEELVTVIKYDQPTVRKINIICTSTKSLISTSADRIIETITHFPNKKIMVAYNSVEGCIDLAEHIRNMGILQAQEIAILCSKSNKDRAGIYYKELESSNLPSRLNFVTSAYFSGFDLTEAYHLISISGNRYESHALSDKRLKQIAGRCRVGLLSETVIHDIVNPKNPIKQFSETELITTAQTQIDSFKCLQKHFNNNYILKSLYEKVSDALVSVLDDGKARFVHKKNKNAVPVISYLNIDAFLETNKARSSLYSDFNGLQKQLKKDGHKVSFSYKTSMNTVQKQNINKITREVRVKDVISKLRLVKNAEDLRALLLSKNLDKLQKTIIQAYNNLHKHIDPTILLDTMEEKATSTDVRALKNYLLSASFVISAPGDLYRSRVNKYFPVGIVLTQDEILKRWQLILMENMQLFQIDTPTKAVRFLKCHLNCIKRKGKGYEILGDNPYNIPVLSVRKEVEDTNELQVIIEELFRVDAK